MHQVGPLAGAISIRNDSFRVVECFCVMKEKKPIKPGALKGHGVTGHQERRLVLLNMYCPSCGLRQKAMRGAKCLGCGAELVSEV